MVRWLYRTLGSSSTQLLLVSSSLFFRSCRIALLVDSTWPFDYGYATEDLICFILGFSNMFSVSAPTNCVLLSVTTSLKTLKLNSTNSIKNYMASLTRIRARGLASTHLV